MQVEGPPISRRLIHEDRADHPVEVADSHDNAAFTDDDLVFVDLSDAETTDWTPAAGTWETGSDSRRQRENSGTTSPVTGNAYNRLGCQNESPGDMSHILLSRPPISKQETLEEQMSRLEAKDTFNPLPLTQQSSQNVSDPQSTLNNAHDIMVDPQVGFKLGLKKNFHRSESGRLKKGNSPPTPMGNKPKKVDLAKSSQKQTGLSFTKHTFPQETSQRKVSFGQDNVIEEAIDANLYFHPSGPPQRNWTAYKSAMHYQFQPRSMSATTGKEGLHPSFGTRSQSMRLPRQRTTHPLVAVQPKQLLRELSFSDSGAEKIHDYGSLVRGQSLPRRTLESQPEDTENLDRKDDSKLPAPAIASLIGLMEELLDRGKIREVALLSLAGGAPVASLPVSWTLPANVGTSLVKAVLETSTPLVRLTINEEKYVCLKHGPDRMVGHSVNNDVLVAQKTALFIVLGLSEEETPGSCLQEVLELVEILTEKGW
ncbi:hypothetical protein EGW08_008005 [Elysia chlorotica]|uniref:Profilin n=1 Tax=Elysia chlorotica TaxID=188477 RepID=A0A3S1BHV8_ELYCH|nr:hypothetical protein EGW08_008005 [Elysia chlorotica]